LALPAAARAGVRGRRARRARRRRARRARAGARRERSGGRPARAGRPLRASGVAARRPRPATVLGERPDPPAARARTARPSRPDLAGWRPDANGTLTAWAGLRPATPDGLPLIGELPGHPGVFVTAGHGMLGVTLAPATAALLAPLVLEGRAAPELVPFDPARK